MENMLFTTHGDNEPYTLATGAIECDDGIWYKRKGNEGVYATINGKHSNITDDPLLRYNIKIPQAWSTAEMKRMHDLDWPLSFKYVGNDNTSTQNYDQEDTGNLRTYQGKVKRMCLSAVTPLYKKLGSIYDSSRTGYEVLHSQLCNIYRDTFKDDINRIQNEKPTSDRNQPPTMSLIARRGRTVEPVKI